MGSSAATTNARQIAMARYVWSMSRFLMWPSSCSMTASKAAGRLTWPTTAPPLTATIRRPIRPKAKADSWKLRGAEPGHRAGPGALAQLL